LSASGTVSERATTVQSVPSRFTSATPSGTVNSGSSDTSPLRPYMRSCSRKMTGSSSRMALFKSPFASAGVEGMTTLRPGKCAYHDSIACECCEET
jgi:hypothetical protein